MPCPAAKPMRRNINLRPALKPLIVANEKLVQSYIILKNRSSREKEPW